VFMALSIKRLRSTVRVVAAMDRWERRSYFRHFLWSPIINLRHFPYAAYSWQSYLSSLSLHPSSGSKSLDLGCGEYPRNPLDCDQLYGIDVRTDINDKSIKSEDLSLAPIPFEDNYFDCVSAFDFVEHIPRTCIGRNGEKRQPFIALLNEIFRVLKPGGVLVHLTPACPSELVFRDPTHVNFITDETFPLYFCGAAPWAKMYGFDGQFELLGQVWVRDSWVFGVMQKPKSYRN